MFFFVFVCLFPLDAYTQGTIKGKVHDKDYNETLIGATIIIEGTTIGTTSDFNGQYMLNKVPSGNHRIICSYISYNKIDKEISVKDGEITEIDFDLSGSTLSLEEVTVAAKKNFESEAMLIMERKNSLLATHSVGAQELSRKGISNAEGAVTKVSGISRQEGVKNVFVRGLGDRYNTTTLNGFVLPSEDPEYKNISLDFFSNEMIQAVMVNKVFAASMNGDVGGALIDIKSKDLVSESEFEIGVSTSFNSETSGKDMMMVGGMNSLGYSTASSGPTRNLTSYAFNTPLDPVKVNNPFNYELSCAGGRKFSEHNRFFVAGAIGSEYSIEQGVIRDITATGATDPFYNMTYTKYQRDASHLLLGNLEFDFEEKKLSFNSLYIHSGSIYHADSYGKHTEIFQVADEYNSEGLFRRQQMNDNSIFVNQLIWDAKLFDRISYNAGVSVNNIIGKEPDRRIFRFPSIGNDSVQLAKAENRNERFNSKVTEIAIIPKFNLKYKLSTTSEYNSFIEFGYDARISYKKLEAPIYSHIWNPLLSSPSFNKNDITLDPYINQETYSINNFMLEYFHDTYDVVHNSHGVYVDFIYSSNSSLVWNAGIRGDNIFTRINYEVNRGADIGSDTIKGFFISPSFNLKYVLNEKHQLRLGASRTYTLPQDKEISPFVYLGFEGNENGNPDLEISTNYNVDLKWDCYLSNKEIFSLNAFYKYILNPIARVDQGSSAGLKTFDNVSDHAIAAGLEAELRKNLFSVAEKHYLDMGVNASYIYSRIELEPRWFVQNTSSTLEGAAPYILNADLTYSFVNDKVSLNAAVVMNYMSDKVHTIGTRGYNNLIEERITTLDFVGAIKFNNQLEFRFKAMNLLNPEYRLTREGATEEAIPAVVIRGYKKGVNLDIGITYKF